MRIPEGTCAQAVMRAAGWAPSPIASFGDVGGFAVGDVAYLRVRVVGFVAEPDGGKTAMCSPVERSGEPCGCDGARSTYFCPIAHLVKSAIVAAEIKP